MASVATIGLASHVQAAPASFTNTGTPYATMPDPGSLSQSVTVSGLGAGSTLTSIQISMLHGWVGDLIFTLRFGGTTVVLLDRPLGDTLFSIYFDDSNLNPSYPVTFSAAGLAPADTLGKGCHNGNTVGFNSGCVNASFVPEQPLSAFNGLDLNGEWTLTVTDAVVLERGRLYGWTLTFDAVPVSEPASLALLLAAVGAVRARARRRRPAR